MASLQSARALAPNSEEVLSASRNWRWPHDYPVAAAGALEPLTRMCPDIAQYHYLLGVAFMTAGDMRARHRRRCRRPSGSNPAGR